MPKNTEAKMLDKKLDDIVVKHEYISGTDMIHCPVCDYDYVHFAGPAEYINGNDKYEARGSVVRGDCALIPFRCESGHQFNLLFGFHKGQMFTWLEAPYVVYSEYINSDAWKDRAKEAKARVGYKCQLCNKAGSNGDLHAHHRTYERLGYENPDDITVLCADCHRKFHDILPEPETE